MEKTTTYTAVRGSGRSNHQQVLVRGKPVGEVWRESVIIPKSKARNPMKWRWFARASNDETVLGRGTLWFLGQVLRARTRRLRPR